MKKPPVIILACLMAIAALAQNESYIQTSADNEVLSLESNHIGFLENSVDLYTGDVAFPLNLVNQTAPGGIPVRVSLAYNASETK